MADAGQECAFGTVGPLGLFLGRTQRLFGPLELRDVDAECVVALQPALSLGTHHLGHLQHHWRMVGIAFVEALDHHVLAHAQPFDLRAVLLKRCSPNEFAHMASDHGVGRTRRSGRPCAH